MAVASAVADATWYHTIELPDGTVTPGEYDLRPALAHIPFPADLTGKRCLDVGTRDGFWAFEMEKRGASEVVGVDIPDVTAMDWPRPPRPIDDATHADLARRARTFETARGLLGSGVRRELISVYDISPEAIGSFDFVFLGTLLLHLRDPIGALAAVAGVTRGHLLLNEAISVSLTLTRRSTPTAELQTLPEPFWWLGNPAALRRFATAAGFTVTRQGRPYMIRTTAQLEARGGRALRKAVSRRRSLLSKVGNPHVWLEARPTAPSA